MRKLGVWIITVISGLFVAGAFASSSHTSTPTQTTSPISTVRVPVVETKTEIREESILFSTKEVSDSSLTSGTTKVTTEGVNGKKVLTYEVTYIDGIESSRKLLKEDKIDPISKIIANGTRIPISGNAVGDTYTNVDGNQVQRPIYSDSVPAGASAVCRDGTYSFSQNRRGTCSGHSGVAQWL